MIKTKRTALLQALQKIGPIGRQDSCNKCHQQDPTLTSFKTHKEVVHEDVKYLANQCNKIRTEWGSTGNLSMKVSCKKCD